MNDSNLSVLNRRDLIRSAAASAVGMLAPRILRAAESTEVIVLGAGLAGLNSALLLEELGLKVTLLEASDHVGGRVQTRNFGGVRHELGASDIGVMKAGSTSPGNIPGGGSSGWSQLWRLQSEW